MSQEVVPPQQDREQALAVSQQTLVVIHVRVFDIHEDWLLC